MPQLTRRQRRVVLVLHLGSSIGWLGAAAAYLALGVAAGSSDEADTVRAAWLSVEITGFVLVPLSIASVVTGLAIALGTPWGLVKHYWVLFSFGVTVLAAAARSAPGDGRRRSDIPGV